MHSLITLTPPLWRKECLLCARINKPKRFRLSSKYFLARILKYPPINGQQSQQNSNRKTREKHWSHNDNSPYSEQSEYTQRANKPSRDLKALGNFGSYIRPVVSDGTLKHSFFALPSSSCDGEQWMMDGDESPTSVQLSKYVCGVINLTCCFIQIRSACQTLKTRKWECTFL